jgi:hypothetical protein
MRRREFILGGAAAAWPLTTSAQRFERIRRIGILWPYTETDPDSQARIASLRQALMDLGWIEGRNLRIEYRWGASADDDGRIQRYAMELVALAPDIIVAGSGGIAIALKRTSRTVPIVSPTANDPVGTGLVESLERPGGNTTGLTGFESAPTDKFLELLRQDCAGPEARRGYSQPHQKRRECKFHRNPSRGIAVRSGGERNRFAVCRCDRARHRHLRVGVERWADRAAGRFGDNSSRGHHQPGGAFPAARGLSSPHLRHRWGSAVLRAGHDRPVSTGGGLYRSHPQGRETRRPARAVRLGLGFPIPIRRRLAAPTHDASQK